MKVMGTHVDGRDVERRNALGFDVNHAVLVLQRAIYEQKTTVGDDHAVTFEDVWGEDDVRYAGFVFQREEDEPLCGAWTLAGDDAASDAYGAMIRTAQKVVR